MADLEGTDEKSASVAKDLFSGAMGGIAQVLLGMCFLLYYSYWSSLAVSWLRNCDFRRSSSYHVRQKSNGSF